MVLAQRTKRCGDHPAILRCFSGMCSSAVIFAEDMIKRADLDSAVAVLRADTYRALRIQGVGAVGRLKVRARVTLSEQAPSSVPAASVSGGYPRPASWR